jgi:hypothetical protein
MANLSQLKTTAFKGEELENLMALSSFAHGLRDQYEKRNVPEPDWLGPRLAELGREIAMRTDDAKQKRIRELMAQQQALLSTAEKKKAIEQELAALGAK